MKGRWPEKSALQYVLETEKEFFEKKQVSKTQIAERGVEWIIRPPPDFQSLETSIRTMFKEHPELKKVRPQKIKDEHEEVKHNFVI